MCKCFGRVGEKIVRGWRRCGYLCRSAKGATVDADRLGSHVKDFNPRSREGSDRKEPARSCCPHHFNPRSREGSDAWSQMAAPSYRDFNPRSREGSDTPTQQTDFQVTKISIHAPAKGATVLLEPSTARRLFQSTLPRRERPAGRGRKRHSRHFNPRSREGSDGHLRCCSSLVYHFNPRSREGSDRRIPDACVPAPLFQSTLPRRERLPTAPIKAYHKPAFQSTLPRRERPHRGPRGRIRWPFQSTLPRRERLPGGRFFRRHGSFQSTLPRRERRPNQVRPAAHEGISIHAPAKGATRVGE